MTDCSKSADLFPALRSQKIEVDFKGGDISSDGGSLLLRQVDRRIGLTRDIDRVLFDSRRKRSCEHRQVHMLRQRVYGLALGYEDLNDHDTMRHDLLFRASVEAQQPLASSSTLCRFENRADRQMAVGLHSVLVDKFIASYKRAPKRLVLDFDATDDPIHGQQEGRFFHGFYRHYCFLPLYVFCDSQLLVGYLRPSDIDGARHAWAILRLLVSRLRKAWPKVQIIFRGDSGFCRWRMLRWCEKHRVGYIVGLAKNDRVNTMAEPWVTEAMEAFEKTGKKQRVFSEVNYGALSWDHPRRVIVKAEHGPMGSNPRYVVTNLPGDPQKLYDEIYCQRGDMENRIKEQQLGLFSDRTSCHRWWPNPLRLLLSGLAYVLLDTIRRIALKGTELARAQCTTIRLKLLKIGAIVLSNTRRIRIHLASAYPYQDLFSKVAMRLALE